MLWRNADFSCHAARRGAPTTARGRVRCAVAISNYQYGTRLFNSLSFNKRIDYVEYRLQNFVLEHRGLIENVKVKRTSRLLGKP